MTLYFCYEKFKNIKKFKGDDDCQDGSDEKYCGEQAFILN